MATPAAPLVESLAMGDDKTGFAATAASGDQPAACDNTEAAATASVEAGAATVTAEAVAATVAAETVAAEAAGDMVAIPHGRERYELREEIGRGGMGVVWGAFDRQFSREVAVKELRREANDPSHRERFATECLVTGNLEHPGIPAVYERSGAAEGAPFYAMRRVRGRTLDKALADAADLGDRLELVPALVRVAQTLAYAHANGVVHRDIKPANIIVGSYGETAVLDWGIAKVRGVPTRSSLSPLEVTATANTTRTRAGAIVGTPAYMAPEQAAGDVDAVDERTDVFAVGALLYHLLTGHPPYHQGSASQVIERARRVEIAPLTEAAPRAPRALRAICERAMARNPGERYESATELARALEGFTADALAHHDTGPVGWVARVASAVSLVMILVVVALVVAVIPTIVTQQGVFAYFLLGFALLGLTLAGLEYVTRGRFQLAPLILAMAIVTLLIGVVGSAYGMVRVFELAATPEIFDSGDYRLFLTESSHIALGATVTGGALAIAQFLAWGVVRRRALIYRS